MRKINLKFTTAIQAVMLMASLVACTKDSDTDNIELPEIDPTVASISAKWINKDANSPYVSFEFQTDGTFIVTEYASVNRTTASASVLKVSSLKGVRLPSSPFYRVASGGNAPVTRAESRQLTTRVGKYVITGNVITLTDYGLIETFRASNDEFSFTFKPDGSLESIEFVGSKAPIANNSKRTTLMCRMWDIESIKFADNGSGFNWGSILGPGWEDALSEMMNAFIRFEVDGRQVSLCAMMSQAGTYLSIFRDDQGNYFTEIQSEDLFFGAVSSVVGTWKWVDGKETRVEWAQEGSFGMEGGSGIFEIKELTLEKFVITGSNEGMSYIEEFKAANKF